MLLHPDIMGPFHKLGEVPCGLDVLSSVRILRPFLRQGIHHFLGLLLQDSRDWDHRLALGGLSASWATRGEREFVFLQATSNSFLGEI